MPLKKALTSSLLLDCRRVAKIHGAVSSSSGNLEAGLNTSFFTSCSHKKFSVALKTRHVSYFVQIQLSPRCILIEPESLKGMKEIRRLELHFALRLKSVTVNTLAPKDFSWELYAKSSAIKDWKCTDLLRLVVKRLTESTLCGQKSLRVVRVGVIINYSKTLETRPFNCCYVNFQAIGVELEFRFR